MSATTPFERGHGHIFEGDPRAVPSYAFVGVWPPEDASRLDPRSLVRLAFLFWSSVASDRPNLQTGIEFREADATPQIRIAWQDLPDQLNGGDWNFTTRELRFDSSLPWSFALATHLADATLVPAGRWHFFSVALHETGHVAGLAHQRDLDDVMTPGVGAPPDSTAVQPRYFTALDDDSLEAIRDLYSIPAAADATPGTPPSSDATPSAPPRPEPPPRGPGCCHRGTAGPASPAQRGGSALPLAILLIAIGLARRRRA